MVVLPQDQIDDMNKIMDYILANNSNPNVSVADIKKKYKLTGPEYDMIYDLCMPLIRNRNTNDSFWRKQYLRLRLRVSATVRRNKSPLANKLRAVLTDDRAAYENDKINGLDDEENELEEEKYDNGKIQEGASA